MGKYTPKLQDKKVLLIGGTSGIGFAVAEAVLEFGGIAIVSSSQQVKLDSAVQRLKSSYPEAADRIEGIVCDLSDSKAFDENLTTLLSRSFAFNSVSDVQCPIHHIVYTAGNRVYPIPPISDASLEVLGRLTSVRYTAAVFLAKHAPKYLAPGPESSITFTTNISEYKPLKGWALSTGATSLNGMVTGLAVDLAPVRVNVVKVGFVATELLREAARMGLSQGGEFSKESELEVQAKFDKMTAGMAQTTLTGRVAAPEDVAEAYLYFMRDRNVTGQSVVTDGGRVLT